MTTLRDAAKQALEALEDFGMKHYENTGEVLHRDVYESLKEALVEDAMQKFTDVSQEIEAALGCDHCNQPLYAAIKCRVCGRVTEPVQEPVQEPVAWIDDSGHPKHLSHLQSATERRLYGPLRPLYTAPPQRKPLTREEAIALWADKSDGPSNSEIVLYCRAIERAHGIDGAPKERNFCPRCGKRLQAKSIHTCTPPGGSDE